MSSPLPKDYPQRHELNNEVHARPYAILHAPERVSYLAVLVNEQDREREWEHFSRLFTHYGQTLSQQEHNHLNLNLGDLRIKIERHQEFTSYQFICHGEYDNLYNAPLNNDLPSDWLATIPGQTLVATHIAIIRSSVSDAGTEPSLMEAAPYFDNATLVGSKVGRNANRVYTDFRIHTDGYTRMLFIDKNALPTQTGRLILRLLEIETYRMLALLALPSARNLIIALAKADKKLTLITDAIARGSDKTDEQLLEELTQFAATVEHMVSANYHRFAASRSYFGLVANRLTELREAPIEGIPTLGGFLNRRLDPARQTCDSAARWLELLPNRVSHASELLRSRVDVKREAQNQSLLVAMNQRAELQLHLQQTVEGLSVAAITYYAVSLIGYLVKASDYIGPWRVDADIIRAAAIPLVAGLVYIGIRRIKHTVHNTEK
ncbi:MAG: DUF3422 domain-containing protein [Gallionella sp.]|nr:DUF3422 domain-containing protein [Gallionella sp.]